MKKSVTKVIIASVVAISTLCSCSTILTPPSTKNDVTNTSTDIVTTETKPKLDIDNLQKNEYRLTELPGKITVSDTYNVYSTDNEFTEEMCLEQGVDYEKAKTYVELQKSLAGIDMFIIPKSSNLIDNDFQISVKVKEDNTYEFENLSELSSAEFSTVKTTLLVGFEKTFGSDLTSDIYENQNLKWIVLEGTLVQHEIRYATIINGKMIYFCVENINGPLTEAQKQEVTKIIDSLQY